MEGIKKSGSIVDNTSITGCNLIAASQTVFNHHPLIFGKFNKSKDLILTERFTEVLS